MLKLYKILIFMLIVSVIYGQSDKRIAAFKNSLTYEESNEYEKALSEIENIYSQNKSDYVINLRMGWLNYLNKDYSESIKFYNEALKISNNSIESLLGLTYPYSAKDDWSKVKEIYKKIIEKDKLNYTANLRLGQILLNSGDYLNAKVYLEKVYSLYPSDYETNLYLGWTNYYLKNNTKAAEYFSVALFSYPSDSSALEGLLLTK